MRKTSRIIIALAAVAASIFAVSCAKEDNTLRYNNATMGNVIDGVFISDQGNKFNVKEQTCRGKIDTMKRAFVICDVLNNTAGAENEYDIRLNYLAKVLLKDAVPVSSVENLDTYMNDPVIDADVWISGGYINMQIAFPAKRLGGKPHTLNLLHEKKDGVYKFMIRHNAEGEIIKEEGQNEDLVIAYAFASFPVTSIITEETAAVEVDLKAYLIQGSVVTKDSEMATIKIDYKKNSFEQAQPTLNSASFHME